MLEPASAFSTNTNTFSKYEIQHLVMGFESDETVALIETNLQNI